MVRHSVMVLSRILGALFLLLLVGVAGLAVRLSVGPIPLNAITPYIAESLNASSQVLRFEFGHTVLAWETATHSLDLQVTDVRIFDVAAAEVAAAPALSLSFSPAELFRGRLRVYSIEVIEPHLWAVRDESGAFSLGMWYDPVPSDMDSLTSTPDETGESPVESKVPDDGEPDTTGLVDALLAGLLASPSEARNGAVGGALARVSVVDADVSVIDRELGVTWHFPRSSFVLSRQATGIKLSSMTELETELGLMTLDLQGEYESATQSVTFDGRFDNLLPSALSRFSASVLPQAVFDLPLKGTFQARIDRAGDQTFHLGFLKLDLQGDEGTIHLLSPVAATYPVRSLAVKVTATQFPDAFQIAVEDVSVLLSRPGEEKGDGPVFEVRGTYRQGQDGLVTSTVALKVRDVHFDDLGAFWPEVIAPDPRAWIVSNLRKGVVSEGWWRLSLGGSSLQEVEVVDLAGVASVTGVEVTYLSPMPAVQDVSATMVFSPDTLVLSIENGTVYGLRTNKGAISIDGLNAPVQRALINLTIEGSAQDALRLIDNKPLEYAKKMALDPKAVSGKVQTDLKLSFPLLDDLAIEDVQLQVDSVLQNVSVSSGPMGLAVSEADLVLGVDAEGLDARGTALFSGIPVGFSWRENFEGKPFASLYKVRATLSESQRAALGIGSSFLISPYLGGPVSLEAEITQNGKNKTDIAVSATLDEAVLGFPELAWQKASGIWAKARVQVEMEGKDIKAVPHFSLQGQDVQIEGSVSFLPHTLLDRVRVDVERLGETKGEVTLTRLSGGYDMTASLPVLDLRSLLSSEGTLLSAGKEENAPESGERPFLSVQAHIGKVLLSGEGGLENVRLMLHHRLGVWQSAQINGGVVVASPSKEVKAEMEPVSFSLSLAPADTSSGPRSFSVLVDDAGVLLKGAGLTRAMRGGRLTALGTITAEGRIKGTLSLGSYRLVGAPFLARILSVASLVGIVDALSGEGLAFSQLEVPFVLEGGVLTIKDFHTSGAALGLTGYGSIDLKEKTITASGNIVPVYALNSLVGNIPILGDILTGFETGGGVFAVSYSLSGPLGEPEISINPLTMITPGFLRNIFRANPSSSPASPVVPDHP